MVHAYPSRVHSLKLVRCECSEHCCATFNWRTWLRMQVDQVWREVMEGAKAAPGCLAMAANAQLLHTLQSANRTLEEVQRGLAAYLEIKRLAFPRCVVPGWFIHRSTCWIRCVMGISACYSPMPGRPCLRTVHLLMALRAPLNVQTGGNTLPRMRQVLLFVQRRDAGDPGGDQGPAARAAPLQKVLRGCAPHTLKSPPSSLATYGHSASRHYCIMATASEPIRLLRRRY